jgi:hypothetical protein
MSKSRQIAILRRQTRALGGAPNPNPTLPPPGVDCTHGPNRKEADNA